MIQTVLILPFTVINIIAQINYQHPYLYIRTPKALCRAGYINIAGECNIIIVSTSAVINNT